MKTYSQFYREVGVRSRSQARSPNVLPVSDIELPHASIYHYYTNDGVAIGPGTMDFPLQNYRGHLYIEHIHTLEETEGGPTENNSVQPNRLRQDYHRQHRKIRMLRDFDRATRNENALIIENYAMLYHLYYYRRSMYATYYRWRNIVRTMLVTFYKRAQNNNRQHFITLDLPGTLPHPRDLDRAIEGESAFNRELFESFADDRQSLILELWRVLGGQFQASALKQAQLQDLDKLNLLIYTHSHFCCVNLGQLIRLFYSDLQELAEDKGSMGNDAQRSLMRLLLSMMEYRNNNTEVDEKETDDERSVDDEEHDDDPIDPETLQSDLEMLEQARANTQTQTEITEETVNPRQQLHQRVEARLDAGRISVAQAKRLHRLIENSAEIENPFGEGTLDEHRRISDEELQITEQDKQLYKPAGVVDESMTRSSVEAFDSKYIREVLSKDISNAVMALEKAGVIVRDIQTEEYEDATDHYRRFKIRVQPVDGEASTLEFKLPVVDESGTLLSGGSQWTMRKQRNDTPIRKVTPRSVKLTSYYAQHYVTRSERKVVNYEAWLQRQLIEISSDDNDPRVSDLKLTNTFNHQVELPRIYTILAKRFRELTIDNRHRLYVDYAHRKQVFGEELVKFVESNADLTFAGMSDGYPIVVGFDNIFYRVGEGEPERLGSIEELVGLDRSKAPVEIAEFHAYTRRTPLVFVLGMHYGLERLLEYTQVEYRTKWSGESLNLQDHEFSVRFNDATLIFSRDDPRNAMIFAGLNGYHRSIARYPLSAFNSREVYANIFEENGFKVGFLRELELSFELFVDPITEDLLREIEEPTTLGPLLIRACELLLTDEHPKETDLRAMRIRGYERIAGHLYGELSRAMRSYRGRSVGGGSKLEMNPNAVFQQIIKDPAVIQRGDTNPINNLKQHETMTFTGTGGRTTQSMVRRTRVYHDSDMGVVSEATTDDGKVGSNAYFSANPQITTLRGQTERYNPETTENSSLLSTSALNAPASEHDDPKRINFISIQNTHVVATNGAHPMPLRTGYEKMLAHRSESLYAHVARANGFIEYKDEEALVIRYDDDSADHVQLGTQYGEMQGTTIPQRVICDLATQSRVQEGDVVAFNTGFFERDPLDPRQVLYKEAILAKTAILENAHTWEDASAISEKLSSKLVTQLTEKRVVVVDFDQDVELGVNLGDMLELESILCTISDPISDDAKDDTLDIPDYMKTKAPKAKVQGVLDRLEVYYRGDKDQMSESVRALADDSDENFQRRSEKLGRKPITGEIQAQARVAQTDLNQNQAMLVFYINEELGAGVGDKGVFGNQMKSVFSNVLSGTNETESGVEIDALFSYLSIANRIVLSPEIMGTTNTLLKKMSHIVAQTYYQQTEE